MDIPQTALIGSSLDNVTAGAVQDLEITHIPASDSSQEEEEEGAGLTLSTSQAGDNSSIGELQTLEEEDDYLAPLFSSSSSQYQESSAQQEETPRSFGETAEQVRDVRDGDARETTETEFYKKMFLSLMTKREQIRILQKTFSQSDD